MKKTEVAWLELSGRQDFKERRVEEETEAEGDDSMRQNPGKSQGILRKEGARECNRHTSSEAKKSPLRV